VLFRSIDCIAENSDLNSLKKNLHEKRTNFLLFITGLESYENDILAIHNIKKEFSDCKVIVFGHYPTYYPKETIEKSICDFVILGEPELTLLSLIKTIINEGDISVIDGIAYYKKNDEFIQQGQKQRISNLDDIPMPAIDLLKNPKAYGEPMMKSPYGMIQSARGCPYQCNFCIKSYGSKFTKTASNKIIEEIKKWKELHQIKSFRFIDDTFTVDRSRVIDVCQSMIDENVNLEWSCLSRTDNLDYELIELMKKAGCKRIYFGQESGSQEILKKINKNIDIAYSLKVIEMCNQIGVETAAFFMSGYPFENKTDFKQTLSFISKSKLNFASLNPLVLYPGTTLFEEYKDYIDFKIYPYKNEWKNKNMENISKKKKKFYFVFYLRLSFFWINRRVIFSYFFDALKYGLNLLRYLIIDNKFVISGIKPKNDK